MTLYERLAVKAEEWTGVPYIHRGTTRRGCDCTGLLIGCLQELGYIPAYRLRQYPKDWNLHAMAGDFIREELAHVAAPLIGKPIPGDLLLFRFGKCVAHCGILIRGKLFVHAHTKAAKVESGTLATPKWSSRFVEAWRLDPARLEGYR